LGRWIREARAIGGTKTQKDLYEKNARSLISIWGPYDPDAIQYDYAARQWNGMVSTFYKPRWEKFIRFLQAEFRKDTASRYKEININHEYGRPKNEANDFYRMLSRWEADWVDTHNYELPVAPAGNEVTMVKKMYEKWKMEADSVY
jgi:alpha-N-acetylglucosaminidase